jgi:hypothetical protein
MLERNGKSNVNKIVMKNEPSGSNIFYKNQYALKQGLNLSNSLGLEVREEKLNLTPKYFES